MPRRTAKSRKANNANGNTTGNVPTATNSATTTPTTAANNADCTPPPVRRGGRAIKKEKTDTDIATEIVTEQVYHRKSERRRVARDIFLVFEEQPSSRRSGRTNKKQPTKPKFGHLKVEDPIKSKGLLRDIKNEPKCYLTNSSSISTNSRTAPLAAKNITTISRSPTVHSENKSNLDALKIAQRTKNSPAAAPALSKGKLLGSAVKETTAAVKLKPKEASDTTLPLVARVNPIFLWVKQDDTRIIEVRCEDYDKRNRIRITKTSNGWRAIPRSDPSSSKVLKYYPTPLMKVKRENHVQQQQHQQQQKQQQLRLQEEHETNNNSSICPIAEKHAVETACKTTDFLSENTLKEIDVLINNVGFKLKGIDSVVCNPLAKKPKKKKKSSKRKKKSSASRKNSKNTNVTATTDNVNENPTNADHLSPSKVALCANENNAQECQESAGDASQQESAISMVACKIDKDIIENRENSLISPTVFVEDVNRENGLERTIKTLVNSPIAPPSLTPTHAPVVAPAIELESTYQKVTQEKEELSFQLCPKTGLFLQNNRVFGDEETQVADNVNNHNNNDGDDDGDNEVIEGERLLNASCAASGGNHNKEHLMVIDLDKMTVENKSQPHDDNTAESLEAKTKNLKDLLDDADLLQHCDDNANSDADLIDTLVKTSCENNLIQANEIIAKGGNIEHVAHHHNHHHHQQQHHSQKSLQHSTNELVVQLITDVSDPPKCLSFNEAGEIEGLNGELFQATNSYMETFEKQPSSGLMTETQLPPLSSSLMSVVTSATSAPQQAGVCDESIPVIMDMMDINDSSSSKKTANIIDDSPKDLSYKKREEVCPPSESRSQCAVTSSSDVVKSPQHDTAALTSSSETLKTLILEQFMKLNAISNSQQKDAIDLGKQRQPDVAHTKSSIYSQAGTSSSNFIETVVIDDDDEEDDPCVNSDVCEEPLKKRIRLNTTQPLTSNSIESANVKTKMVMIDKDPDPLTQLRLLIQNTQWKVPDPILVPKDRLSAVLASPAREIPLLITTRPELRLPEAFAYPEIIQNPNILVISMAQLEAILQNEVEVTKTSGINTDLGPKSDIHSPEHTVVQLTKQLNDFQAAQSRHHFPQLPAKPNANNLGSNSSCQMQNNNNNNILNVENTSTTRKENDATKCSHMNSSLATDINAATMAVLNQMLWLPYFGQISQDLLKSLKNPLGMQHKCAANLMPFYGSQLNGLQNLEDVYKSSNIINQMTQMSHNDPSAAGGLSSLQQQDSTDEMSLFKKIIQHQMQNVLQLNQQLKSTEAVQRKVATPTTTISATTTVNPLQSSIETSGANAEPISNFVVQHKKSKICLSSDHKNMATLAASKTSAETGCNNNSNVTEKSYNLRSSVAGRQATESKQYSSSSNNQRQNADNKPRLTCKSLSNLLDPEHSHQHSMSSSSSASATNPYVPNLTSDFLKGISGVNAHHPMDCKNIGRSEGRISSAASDAAILPPSTAARSACSQTNASIEGNIDFSKQQKSRTSFGENMVPEHTLTINDASSLSTETNVPLWHPLFGR